MPRPDDLDAAVAAGIITADGRPGCLPGGWRPFRSALIGGLPRRGLLLHLPTA